VSAAVFQSALARLVVDPDFRDGVRGRGAEALPEELSDLERERLLAVAVDRGLDITRTLHVGFRLAKLLAWIPLTCAVLGREVRIREVGEFWKRRLPVSFYYLEEAVAFCDYILDRVGEGLDIPYLEEVAAYERASLELRRARPAGEPVAPQTVEFRHDPEALLGALARGEELGRLPEMPCRLMGRKVEGGVEWGFYSRHQS
jgi:hypothetical protein